MLREAGVSSAHGTVAGAGWQRNARVRPWKSVPNSLALRCLPASTMGPDAGGAVHVFSYLEESIP